MMRLTTRRIKVLRIIGECKSGGTETIALNYYQCLAHNRIAMDFLFFGDSLSRFDRTLEANGDRVINVPEYSKHPLKSIWQISRAVRQGGYDIVHSQLNALNLIPLLGAWLGGAGIRICANHSTANLKHEFKKSVVKYIMRPTATWFATNYAACSKHAGAWLFGKRNVEQGNVRIIHNAIDLSRFSCSAETRQSVRTCLGWDGRFVIGHGGRFVEQKNHKFIVEVFYEIHKQCPEALLILIGDGKLTQSIKDQVHELGLDESVKFLGVRFDMNQLMQGMDVFLFPSLYEGLGNVLLEAQAVGLQSVASDVVPKEVKLTKFVDFISLEAPARQWAENILNYRYGYVHEDTHEIMCNQGYEIEAAAKTLEDYYYELTISGGREDEGINRDPRLKFQWRS